MPAFRRASACWITACQCEKPASVPERVSYSVHRAQVLTLGMDVPEAWLVEAVRAEPDLDNLRLADLGAAGGP